MFRIEGLKPCKKCNLMPDFMYQSKYFSFTCPVCKRGSSTHMVHGVEVAIEDWNKYHSKYYATGRTKMQEIEVKPCANGRTCKVVYDPRDNTMVIFEYGIPMGYIEFNSLPKEIIDNICHFSQP